MNKAIIIGHNEDSKGAFSEHLNKSEWDFYRSFESKLNEVGDVFLHDPTIEYYTDRCIDISERIGNSYDIVFALHFNKFNGEVGGCEVWYWHTNESGKKTAGIICDKVEEDMGISNRGPKEIQSKKQRGGGEVYYPKTTALLLEPFFGDFKEDCDNFDVDKFIKILKDINE